MTLPPRKPKKAKSETRWRSQAHLGFVRSHCCSACHTDAGIEAAHVRIGSGAGMGQKPDDWRAVSLCRDCHRKQHEVGEYSFWGLVCSERDDDDIWTVANPYALIEAFCKASPKASEIRRIRQEAA